MRPLLQLECICTFTLDPAALKPLWCLLINRTYPCGTDTSFLDSLTCLITAIVLLIKEQDLVQKLDVHIDLLDKLFELGVQKRVEFFTKLAANELFLLRVDE